MVLWSLDENQTNYRNSKIRAYNNTVDGLINIPDSGSIGGHDIRNNICTDIREFGVELPGHIIQNNVFTVGSFLHRWSGPGNTFNSDLFVSAPTGNFELHSNAAAIHGQLMLGPMSLELSVNRGNETALAPEDFLFYRPAYDNWAENHLPPREGNAALQDPDGDHLSNLLEFATGSSPTDPSPSPLFPSSPAGGRLPYMRFYRNTAATDVFLTVEYSSDLRSWAALRPGNPRITVADPNPSGDGSRILMQVAPDSSSLHGYYRLRAVKAQP